MLLKATDLEMHIYICIYIWERGRDGTERMGVEVRRANTVRREVWNSVAGVKALVLTVIRASFVS